MKIFLSIVEWLAWSFVAFLALSLSIFCRTIVSQGKSFQWATAVQTFFWWITAIVFLFTPLNKLHILWLLPVLFFGARFLVFPGIPILTPVILFLLKFL